jgi:septal ring factor EnvC (AmiA/AmiB activator)
MIVSQKKIEQIEQGVRASFAKIKYELDEHLDSINQTTTEVTQSYEYLQKLESRIDKLEEKLDAILTVLEPQQPLEVGTLTTRQKEVLQALYTHTSLSVEQLVRYVALPSSMIVELLQELLTRSLVVVTEQGQYALHEQIRDTDTIRTVLNIPVVH